MRTTRTFVMALAFTGCASSPARPPLAEIPAEPPPAQATPGTSASVPPAPVAGALPATAIDGPEGLRELCDVLASEERVSFPGSEAEKARAREEHRSRRLEAAGARYFVDVPPHGFAFRRYDIGERRLPLHARPFPLGDGAEVYAVETENGPFAFDLGPEGADVVAREHAERRLRLRLVFRPARSEVREEMCLRLSGGQVVKLGVEPLAAYLVRDDGVALARAEGQEFADVMDAAVPVREPVVTVGHPTSSDPVQVSEAIVKAVLALGPDLKSCYTSALQNKPALRGTLAVGGRLGMDGKLESPQMEVSSIGDDALVTCVVARLARAKLPAPPAAVRLSIPIAFGGRR